MTTYEMIYHLPRLIKTSVLACYNQIRSDFDVRGSVATIT